MDANRESDRLVQGKTQSLNSNATNSKPFTKTRNICGPQTWLYETLSLIFATLSLIGLVAILRHHQNQPEPQWRAGITLNTVVSIVSTAFRAALIMPVAACISQLSWLNFTGRPKSLDEHCVYDEASRGPLGSLRLVYRTRLSHVACIGAAITIITLGLDPFFQQTVRFTPQSTAAKSQAIASAAHNYNGSIEALHEFSNAYTRLPYNMKAAMYNGLLSSQLLRVPDPPFSCPSGNCTWDPFLTLGIDTHCIDNTHMVKLNCSLFTPKEGWIPVEEPAPGSGGTAYELCNLTAVDDNPFFKDILPNPNWYTLMVISAGMSRNMALDPSMTKPFGNITGLLGTVSWAKVTGGDMLPDGSDHQIFNNSTFEAFTCGVYLSVMEVKAQVTSGVYEETVLQSIPRIYNSSEVPIRVAGSTSYFWHDPWDMNDIVFKLNLNPRKPTTELRVSAASFQILASQLVSPDFLQGDVTFGSADGATGTTELAQMLWRAENTTKAMETMAKYMTNSLRSNDSLLLQDTYNNASIIAPSQSIYGQVHIDRPFVGVRYAWLILPAAILALSCDFLAITIVKTLDGPLGLWKESPLALFLHATIDRSVRDALREMQNGQLLDTVESMEKLASKLDARVISNYDGQVFVEVSARAGDNILKKEGNEVRQI